MYEGLVYSEDQKISEIDEIAHLMSNLKVNN